MEKSAHEEEKELQQEWRKIQVIPNKKSPLRQKFLQRLITAAKSPHSVVKRYVASQFKECFKDFPDLQNDVIDAVFDLCEDPDKEVRLQGYKAIDDVSSAEPKWVKRNVDVLIQLLQTEDSTEVTTVKQTLSSHMDIDVDATWGVFLDQMCPQNEPMDDDDRKNVTRTRALLISYLVWEATHTLPGHMAKPDQEIVITRSLLEAVGKLPLEDAKQLVHDVLLPLPSFSAGSPRMKELNDVLLKRTERSLHLTEEAVQLLETTCAFTVTRKLVEPCYLLQFIKDHFEELLPRTSKHTPAPALRCASLAALLKAIAACQEDNITEDSKKAAVAFTMEQEVTIIFTNLAEHKMDLGNGPDDPDLLLSFCAFLNLCSQRPESDRLSLSKAGVDRLRQLNKLISANYTRCDPAVPNRVHALIRSLEDAYSRAASRPDTQRPKRKLDETGGARRAPDDRNGRDAPRRPQQGRDSRPLTPVGGGSSSYRREDDRRARQQGQDRSPRDRDHRDRRESPAPAKRLRVDSGDGPRFGRGADASQRPAANDGPRRDVPPARSGNGSRRDGAPAQGRGGDSSGLSLKGAATPTEGLSLKGAATAAPPMPAATPAPASAPKPAVPTPTQGSSPVPAPAPPSLLGRLGPKPPIAPGLPARPVASTPDTSHLSIKGAAARDGSLLARLNPR